jgi:tRNA1Val (adenine37-N6)-methyltransferase
VGVKDFTDDTFLGGRVRVRQPACGFRSGLDAVMLAAAIPARAGDEVLELGSGAGVASLCLAGRVPGCSITGVEIDGALVSLANSNAAVNGGSARVRFMEADALHLPRALRKGFDHVFCNPPFHGDEGQRSPDARRARATHDEAQLRNWLSAGVKRVAANGAFTAIVRADRLAEALAGLPASAVAVVPLWPKTGEAAKRVILQVRAGSRAPLQLLPGLVLHEVDGHYTREAQLVLRDAAALPF